MQKPPKLLSKVVVDMFSVLVGTTLPGAVKLRGARLPGLWLVLEPMSDPQLRPTRLYCIKLYCIVYFVLYCIVLLQYVRWGVYLGMMWHGTLLADRAFKNTAMLSCAANTRDQMIIPIVNKQWLQGAGPGGAYHPVHSFTS